MKKFIRFLATTAIAVFATAIHAAIITVNTTNNTDFGAGVTNLVRAITLLQDGDTLRFNIPGAGPHYLITPPFDLAGGTNGYPAITKHNVTIDGYSQPGATPNTNPILAANNSQIKIVLDSRNGGRHMEDIAGYGTSESATLFVVGATNVTIKGFCFLGPGPGEGNDTDPSNYAIAFGLNATHGHVNGCWFGVDLDGRSVFRFKDAVTGFQGPSGEFIDELTVGVARTAPDAAAARAQFNVIVGEYIALIIEGRNTRIAGNFINVFPDGVTDHNVSSGDIADSHSLEAFIEIGGGTSAGIIIGTDGDGLNDSDERNVFGGVTAAGDNRLLEWYSGSAPRTNMVIAGNYFGLGVDGVTRFTNSMKVFNSFNSTATVQFGSDFDGVSDAIEGNVISMNYPFNTLFPTPESSSVPIFGDLSAGARVSLRGNILVGNNLPLFSYADGSGGRLNAFTNYSAPYMDTNSDIVPILSSASIFPRLTGTCALPVAPYTNIIIDVYQLDPEGWANGKLFGLLELIATDGSFTNGFPQGRKYLGSFIDNGPKDSNPAVGQFSLDLSGLDLGAGLVTVTANYSADPPGTHNGRTHTSNFSNPAGLIPGGAISVGVTHTVPDVAIWYHKTGNYVTNGPVDPAAQTAPLDNWEPYIGVMGDTTFLIGFNTFADDQTEPAGATISAGAPFQRFAVAFQPAAGGDPKIGEHLFTDAGAPYRGVANYRRQNGNPQRVAGDKRLGGTTFLPASETSIGQNPAFQSDSRWTSNACYNADNAYVTVQAFSLNPTTLVQTPLSKAFDPLYGNFVSATPPVTQPQVSRTGGKPEGLDNGNFVVVSDDRTGYLDPDTELTSFAVITPTGTVVKSATLVDLNDIWDNVAAFRGGFAIRVHSFLYFFDNNGNPTHTNDINISSGLTFGTGREDASRIGSDIRSYYVYLAGKTPDTGKSPVSVAIWDSRTGAFVARATVSDTDPSIHTADRVVVASDALDRFCVAYSLQPTADFTKRQVAARVMKFDGTNITYLTHSFFPFVNSESNPTSLSGVETFHPSVAMTTRQICIAAKGQINSTNSPSAGPNTALQTPVYTVISHPDPQDTPGSGPLEVSDLTISGQAVTISWTGGTGPYLLQKKSSLSDPAWQNVLTSDRQSESVALQGDSGFFRVSDHATNTVTSFTAFLDGDGERPQVTTGATALGSFSLEANTLTYFITFSGLSAPATAAHIHGPTNTTASIGIIIPFPVVPAATSGTISGSVTVSEQQKGYLLSGLTYANIHNTNHAGGEIRGQIGQTQLKAVLNGANERPAPVVTPGTGTGTLTRIGNQLLFNITYSGLGSSATAAHIHGRADSSGFAVVLLPLPTPTGTSGTIAGSLPLDNATLSAIVDGLSYINIHTQNNTGGEIRGQVTP